MLTAVYYDGVLYTSSIEKIKDHNLKEEPKSEQPSFPSLRALVIGLEHSGTTLAGRLIKLSHSVIATVLFDVMRQSRLPRKDLRV